MKISYIAVKHKCNIGFAALSRQARDDLVTAVYNLFPHKPPAAPEKAQLPDLSRPAQARRRGARRYHAAMPQPYLRCPTP
ncbi:MAG: hypothetical protein LH491_05685 [Pseudoxanthomonas sp.]|nr:hypothetical protein [Pseudoxanthomonas sp.]